MRKAAISALTLLATLHLAATTPAALIEHHFVVDPVFIHQLEKHNVSHTHSYTSSSLLVPVPEVTLSPGDTVRVTVELVPGKHLRLGRTLPNGYQEFVANLVLIQPPYNGGAGSHGNGTTDTVEFFDATSQLFLSDTEPSRFSSLLDAPTINLAYAHAYRRINVGEPTDATFRKWTFEWNMPTTVTTFFSTYSNTTTTFTQNAVHIGFYSYGSNYALLPPEAVYVVPEPASLTLLAIALAPVFCGSRLRRRFQPRNDLAS